MKKMLWRFICLCFFVSLFLCLSLMTTSKAKIKYASASVAEKSDKFVFNKSSNHDDVLVETFFSNETTLSQINIYNLSNQNYLSKAEFGFASGTLIVYRSFLLTLDFGNYSFIVSALNQEFEFNILITADNKANYIEDFNGQTDSRQGYNGWYYYFTDSYSDLSNPKMMDPSSFTAGIIDRWINGPNGSSYIDLTSRLYCENRDYSSCNILIGWQAHQTGTVKVDYLLKAFEVIKLENNAMIATTISLKSNLGEFIENKIFTKNDFLKDNIVSFTNFINIEKGDLIYFGFQLFSKDNNGNNFNLNIDISPISHTVSFFDESGEVCKQNVTNNGYAAPYNIEKQGYDFKGWHTDDGQLFDFDMPITSNITLIAKWEQSNNGDLNSPQIKASYIGGNLNIKVEGNHLYSYQYWIRACVGVDLNSENLQTESYIWQILYSYEVGNTEILLQDNPKYIDNDGNISIIVRIKDQNNLFIGEISAVFNAYQLGKTQINSVLIDKNPLENINIVCGYASISVNATNATSYEAELLGKLYYSTDGTFNFDFNEVSQPSCVLKVRALGDVDVAEKDVLLYVVTDYKANETATIQDLKGESDLGGKTLFTLTLKYADGLNLTLDDLNNYKINFNCNGLPYHLNTAFVNDYGQLELKYLVDFNGKYGIYYTYAEIINKKNDTADDKIIRYYSSYIRKGYIAQQSQDKNVSLGSDIKIYAEGNIDGVSHSDLLYAFYREDASGWVKIKDYTNGNTLNWTPLRAGLYKIQVRIKSRLDSGSWEAACSEDYYVKTLSEQSGISLTVIDYFTKKELNGPLIVGRPYILQTEINESFEDKEMLFMYTFASQNLGGIYLNNYNTKNTFIFILNKSDVFTITARVINIKNFGYKDISLSLKLSSIIA